MKKLTAGLFVALLILAGCAEVPQNTSTNDTSYPDGISSGNSSANRNINNSGMDITGGSANSLY